MQVSTFYLEYLFAANLFVLATGTAVVLKTSRVLQPSQLSSSTSDPIKHKFVFFRTFTLLSIVLWCRLSLFFPNQNNIVIIIITAIYYHTVLDNSWRCGWSFDGFVALWLQSCQRWSTVVTDQLSFFVDWLSGILYTHFVTNTLWAVMAPHSNTLVSEKYENNS